MPVGQSYDANLKWHIICRIYQYGWSSAGPNKIYVIFGTVTERGFGISYANPSYAAHANIDINMPIANGIYAKTKMKFRHYFQGLFEDES